MSQDVHASLRLLCRTRLGCHVCCARDTAGTDGLPRLAAWVVPEPGLRTPSPAGLRAQLGRALPDWMVPRDVVLITELPLTERGKVDVGALPPVPQRPEPVPGPRHPPRRPSLQPRMPWPRWCRR